jgi:hypothetical protein
VPLHHVPTLWETDRPVIYVTDLMRREFVGREHRPRLPPGEPICLYRSYGFRHVYVNREAARRIRAGGLPARGPYEAQPGLPETAE